MAKRGFDIIFSILGIMIASPLLLSISLTILVSQGWPVLFAQTRIGLRGKPFTLFKFRTMKNDSSGLLVTASADSRVTGIGKQLRHYKLDELPQLFNVLKGEMSFVGPRPEVPKFVELFSKDYEKILSVKPGITDPASIRYRNEAEFFGSEEPEKNYVEIILPQKIRYYRQYIENQSLWRDIGLIFATLAAIVRKPK